MSSKAYIQRAKHGKTNPYFLMLRSTAQDKALSYEARGMLAYLLSKPDDWRVEIHDLQIKGKCGRDKVYSILNELKDAGYVRREQTKDDKGLFVWGDYEVSEYPFPENPYMEKPDMDNPYTENPTQHNTDKDIVEKPKKREQTWSGEELAISETFSELTNAMVKPHEEKSKKIVQQYREDAAVMVSHGVTPDVFRRFYKVTYTNGYVPSSLSEIRRKIGDFMANHNKAKPAAATNNGQFQNENRQFARSLDGKH